MVRFRYTLVYRPAFPGPLYCNVLALASEDPSGDRASADQILCGLLQPEAKTQTPMIRSEIGLKQVFQFTYDRRSSQFKVSRH